MTYRNWLSSKLNPNKGINPNSILLKLMPTSLLKFNSNQTEWHAYIQYISHFTFHISADPHTRIRQFEFTWIKNKAVGKRLSTGRSTSRQTKRKVMERMKKKEIQGRMIRTRTRENKNRYKRSWCVKSGPDARYREGRGEWQTSNQVKMTSRK